MTVERIYVNGSYAGMIHKSDTTDKWYVTLTNHKRLNKPNFKTCGNGTVRLPGTPYHYTEAMPFESRDEAVGFMEKEVPSLRE